MLHYIAMSYVSVASYSAHSQVQLFSKCVTLAYLQTVVAITKLVHLMSRRSLDYLKFYLEML